MTKSPNKRLFIQAFLGAFEAIHKNSKMVFLLWLFVFLPSAILSEALDYYMNDVNLKSSGAFIALIIAIFVGIVLIAFEYSIAMLIALRSKIEYPHTMSQMILYVYSKLSYLVQALLLSAVAFLVGLVALVLPAIYLWVALSFVFPIILFEHETPQKSLEISCRRINKFFLDMFIICLIVFAADMMIVGAFYFLPQSPQALIMKNILQSIIIVISLFVTFEVYWQVYLKDTNKEELVSSLAVEKSPTSPSQVF